MIYEFTVFHKPMGAPRMTQRDRWQKRDCVIRYRELKDAIRAAAHEVGFRNIQAAGVASLSWTAFFEVPDSWSKKKRTAAIGNLHRSKPDRDNIDKAILDALFDDDSGIASGTIEKRWGAQNGIEIQIVTE